MTGGAKVMGGAIGTGAAKVMGAAKVIGAAKVTGGAKLMSDGTGVGMVGAGVGAGRSGAGGGGMVTGSGGSVGDVLDDVDVLGGSVMVAVEVGGAGARTLCGMTLVVSPETSRELLNSDVIESGAGVASGFPCAPSP